MLEKWLLMAQLEWLKDFLFPFGYFFGMEHYPWSMKKVIILTFFQVVGCSRKPGSKRLKIGSWRKSRVDTVS